MRIYASRFTPGVKAGDIKLEIGEVVQYKKLDGSTLDITIDSESVSHHECDCLGYECIFSDDGKKYFASGDQIINWEGKMETIGQLNKAMEES